MLELLIEKNGRRDKTAESGGVGVGVWWVECTSTRRGGRPKAAREAETCLPMFTSAGGVLVKCDLEAVGAQHCAEDILVKITIDLDRYEYPVNDVAAAVTANHKRSLSVVDVEIRL